MKSEDEHYKHRNFDKWSKDGVFLNDILDVFQQFLDRISETKKWRKGEVEKGGSGEKVNVIHIRVLSIFQVY